MNAKWESLLSSNGKLSFAHSRPSSSHYVHRSLVIRPYHFLFYLFTLSYMIIALCSNKMTFTCSIHIATNYVIKSIAHLLSAAFWFSKGVNNERRNCTKRHVFLSLRKSVIAYSPPFTLIGPAQGCCCTHIYFLQHIQNTPYQFRSPSHPHNTHNCTRHGEI